MICLSGHPKKTKCSTSVHHNRKQQQQKTTTTTTTTTTTAAAKNESLLTHVLCVAIVRHLRIFLCQQQFAYVLSKKTQTKDNNTKHVSIFVLSRF